MPLQQLYTPLALRQQQQQQQQQLFLQHLQQQQQQLLLYSPDPSPSQQRCAILALMRSAYAAAAAAQLLPTTATAKRPADDDGNKEETPPAKLIKTEANDKDVSSWSVEQVASFVGQVDKCQSYAEVKTCLKQSPNLQLRSHALPLSVSRATRLLARRCCV